MTLLAIDPSSRMIGFAVLNSLGPAGLVDAGRIHPSMDKDLWKDIPGWMRSHWFGGGLDAYWRILSMMDDLQGLLDAYKPLQIIVEVPSGKVGTGGKNKARGSLTTYGAAAGAVFMFLWERAEAGVVPVTERQWTAGQTRKDQRPAAITALYGDRYDAAKDTGSDVADAILLGRWWLQRQSAH